MADLFKNKYRIPSARLAGYDYASPGGYFVTICTRDKECWFGMVVNGDMRLSDVGTIACEIWQEIPVHFPNAQLDQFVVMPNHVHGIIILDEIDQRNGGIGIGIGRDAINRVSTDTAGNRVSTDTAGNRVSTDTAGNRVSTIITDPPGGITQHHNPMLSTHSLSKIIRWYKGRCTFEIRKSFPDHRFAWQSRFHDHIIRNEKSFHAIRRYIQNNPAKWTLDRKNSESV